MTDRDLPTDEPDDDSLDIDRELWHVNPDGSGHDKYPPYTSFGPGTMPYAGERRSKRDNEDEEETDR
jgi:hypothetical protein